MRNLHGLEVGQPGQLHGDRSRQAVVVDAPVEAHGQRRSRDSQRGACDRKHGRVGSETAGLRDLQEPQGLEVPERAGQVPRDVVVVQVHADQVPQVAELRRDRALEIVLAHLPARSDAKKNVSTHYVHHQHG